VLSIKKVNAGRGYEYLTRSVVRGDADYYLRGTTTGDPPGVWTGRGAEILGVAGQATEAQVRNLFGLGVHPDDPSTPLGTAFAAPSYVLDRVHAWDAAHPDAPAVERAAAVAAERARGNRNAIAGLDLTFSPPKSWSVLWAAARPHERAAMWAAHHAGVATAVQFLEQHAAFTRTGHDGVRQIETGGLAAVRFDHTTSRAGDVQPHSHLLVSTKVRGSDGRWRALDTRAVYDTLAAAGAIYSTVRDTETARTLGTIHQLRPDLTEREVAGVPDRLRREYSSRRARIETQLAQLVAGWEHRHGAPPSAATRARMSEFVTLETRPGKRRGETVEQMLDRMQQRARGAGFALDTVRGQAIGKRTSPRDPDAPTPDRAAAEGLAAVSTQHTVWTRWQLMRAVENRQGIDTTLTPQQILLRAEADTDAALALPGVRRISAPELLHIPPQLRRRIDDTSVFVRHGGTRYTTAELLDAERLLLDTARTRTGLTVPADIIEQVLAAHTAAGMPLDASQATAVRRFVGEDRALDVLEGPAGSGKSRTMRAVVDAWRATGRDVLGLALSQQAARVLAEESGARTENIARFLHHHSADNTHPRWQLTAGQLVLVDEAAMADTRRMAQLTAAVRAAGGVVRAIGDDAQLASPEAGGWFGLLADDVAAPRLAGLHRFTHPWEAQASLQLRAGDVEAIHTYAAHGRIVTGQRNALEQAAYRAWRDDERTGHTSLLLVGTTARAAHLSGLARADLVALGKVEPDGVDLHDANLAGVGDRVVTRRNDSTNRDTDGRQVANRDHWIVRARRRTGGLIVERLDDVTGHPTGHTTHLDAAYVANHVELAYAAVNAARQGATVDTGHSLADEHTQLAALYVAITRGRDSNTVYVETRRTAALPEDPNILDTPEAVLARILHTGPQTRPISAHQAIRDAQNSVTSLAVLGPVWEDTVAAATRQTATGTLRAAGGEALARAAEADPAWPSVLAVLHHAAASGSDIGHLLATAIAERELTDARGVAAVLHYRITNRIGTGTHTTGGSPTSAWPPYRQRTPSGDHPELAVAHQAAELLDARVDQLRSELAADPPEWTTRTLGTVPADPIDRGNWTRRAAAIAAYRERYRLTSTWPSVPSHASGDPTLALLGSRPHASRHEAALAWDHAHAALGQASELNRLRAATDAELHAAVSIGHAAEQAQPPYARDDLRAAAANLRATLVVEADLRTHIEATNSHPQPTVLSPDLAAALTARRNATATARHRYDTAHTADTRWQDWNERTATTRRTGQLAAELLAARTSRQLATSPGPTPAGARLAQRATAERVAAQRTEARLRQPLRRSPPHPAASEHPDLRSPSPDRPGHNTDQTLGR
jgi:conjugative relaxase-like TrwC/TraI family protein